MLIYPALPQHIRADLAYIEPVEIHGGFYFPCTIIEYSGQNINCAYIVNSTAYFRIWGVWPEDDSKKLSVPIESVAKVLPSLQRLPIRVAAKIYKTGESGMGYSTFTIGFRNNTWRTYRTGGMVDFIELPPGINQNDVIDLLPYQKVKEQDFGSALEYHWCLYSDLK